MVTPQDIVLVMTIDLVNKRVKLTDNTDYAALGLTVNTVAVFGSITGPVGTVVNRDYQSVPLINIFAGQNESEWFDLPVNTNTGEVLLGNYTASIAVYSGGRFLNPAGSQAVGSQINIIGDLTTDASVGTKIGLYLPTGSAGVYTIATLTTTGASSSFTFEEPFIYNGPVGGYVFGTGIELQTELSVTNCLEQSNFVMQADVQYNCDQQKFESSDVSNYQGVTLDTRVHRIQYPRYANGTEVAADVVNTNVLTNKTLVLNNLWTGNYTVSITSTGQITVNSGFILLFGGQVVVEKNVICQSNVIKALSCISQILKAYQKLCAVGSTNQYQCDLTVINTSYLLMKLAQQKGDSVEANKHAQTIIAIANNYGCNCSNMDGSMGPVQIVAGNAVDTSFNQFVSPLQEPGDIFYASNAALNDRLPVGEIGQVLTVGDDQLPQWQNPVQDGNVLDVFYGPFIVSPLGYAMEYSFPAGFFAKDGDGFEFELVARPNTSSGLTILLNLTLQANVELETAVVHSVVKGRVFRLGNNWRAMIMVITPSGDVLTEETTAAATGVLAFDQALDFKIQADNTVFMRQFELNYISNKTVV